MSALSHQQLAMYMTADELKHVVHTSLHPHGDAVLGEKLAEAKNETTKGWGHGLYEDIKKSGQVYEPVEMAHRTNEPPHLEEGHHRVAVANALNPKMLIPVVHHER
jgi:hypothetical protein